ncbi:hypothetical protein MNBD_GAMMA12-3829 [hydrothermal vent metagenome]|uniref:Uncharacterized protein n=1 Tax=hydrothermal vent metagenome TaxID=652676 RepID=A0A3B0YHK3_9ZZZZ
MLQSELKGESSNSLDGGPSIGSRDLYFKNGKVYDRATGELVNGRLQLAANGVTGVGPSGNVTAAGRKKIDVKNDTTLINQPAIIALMKANAAAKKNENFIFMISSNRMKTLENESEFRALAQAGGEKVKYGVVGTYNYKGKRDLYAYYIDASGVQAIYNKILAPIIESYNNKTNLGSIESDNQEDLWI